MSSKMITTKRTAVQSIVCELQRILISVLLLISGTLVGFDTVSVATFFTT